MSFLCICTYMYICLIWTCELDCCERLELKCVRLIRASYYGAAVHSYVVLFVCVNWTDAKGWSSYA